MSIPDQPPLVTVQPAPPAERDARGRFAPKNRIASQGGKARAAALTRKRRRAIARKGYRALIKRHWGGDKRAQAKWFGELGSFVYEVQAGALLPDGSRRPGSPLRTSARHPGPIQEWRSQYYTDSLLYGQHRDIEFMGNAAPATAATAPEFRCRRCGWEGHWWGSKCPNCGG